MLPSEWSETEMQLYWNLHFLCTGRGGVSSATAATAATAVGLSGGSANLQQSPTSAARLCLLRPPGSGWYLALADGSPVAPPYSAEFNTLAIQYLCAATFQLQFCCRAERMILNARILPGIYKVYTRHKSDEIVRLRQEDTRYNHDIWYLLGYGIYQVYTRLTTCIPGQRLEMSYSRYTPGIYQVYDRCCHMSGIYQVYTTIFNFLRIPDAARPPLHMAASRF